jgi:phosphocarrier protein
MIQQDVLVTNDLGLHARPASLIVRAAMKFASSITIHKEDLSADAKSIMSVMMLVATKNSKLTIRAHGSDEAEAMAELVGMFKRNFDE